MTQVDLFTRQTAAELKFAEFHKKNPQVYRELLKLTEQAVARGRSRIGINMLIEVVRWNRFLQTTDEDYKINNNYAPRYARMIMNEHPEYGDIFQLRTLRS